MAMELLTALLVIITGWYAYLTYRLSKTSSQSVEAIKEQNWASSRAFIVVTPFVRPHTPFFYLRIANSGRSSALQVKLSIDKDFFQFAEASRSERNLKCMPAFTQVIEALHPGQELVFALAQGWNIIGDKAVESVCPARFNVAASYECLGRLVSESNAIDLAAYNGSEGERDPIVEELERLRKAVEKIKSVV